jgi:DNA-binding PadR family transcriptional regulator
MPRVPRSNPLAMAVLVCLYEKSMHPYEIAQTLRQRAKHESVRLNYGSLYAVVESLKRRGLIKASETVRKGRRPLRTIYEITDGGSREMIDWLTDLIGVPTKEYPQFMAGLSFIAALEPTQALLALRGRAELLALKVAATQAAMQTAHAAGLPRLFELEGEYEFGQLAAELQFVKSLVSEIEQETLDGIALWRGFHSDNAERPEWTGLDKEAGARKK